MSWTDAKRILRSGFANFWRNGFVTLASILVMTVTLFAIGSLVFSNALVEKSLSDLQDKVDVNVYFVLDAPEDDILDLQKKIDVLPEVDRTEYVSRDEALTRFRDRHANDQLVLQSLDELGDNPLPASLAIKAKDPSQYQSIADFLKDVQDERLQSATPLIDNINFFQNQETFKNLSNIIDSSERANFIKTIVLVIVSILITFNTIRLAIYNSREEIGVMRLVGASNSYTQGPFLVEGVMYGVISAILALIIFYPVTLWLGPLFYPFSFFSDFQSIDLFSFYTDNFAKIFLLVVVTGAVLGAVSSYMAVKRYLKV